MLTSINTMKHFWPAVRNENDSYVMRFKVYGAEVLRRRQKERNPCNENWMDYDNEIKKIHVKKHHCRPPYLNYPKEAPICSNQHEIKKAKFIYRADNYDVLPACKSMDNIFYKYEELPLTDLVWRKEGHFNIMIMLDHHKFKDFTQTR